MSRAFLVLAGVGVFAFAADSAGAAIQFNDVTTAAGTIYTGESYGAAWGDYNADGWPDVFVSNHRAAASLYVNLGNGTFEDRAGEVPAFQILPEDQHGASWSDFDNDGDNDLFVSAGSLSDSQFLVNNGQFLVDKTFDYTFEDHWGGRLPVWFDFNHDGKLDFSMAVQGTKPFLFEQTATDFVKADAPYGSKCKDTDFTQLADVTRDGILDWICITQDPFPEKVYDITTKPFTDRTSVFPAGIPNSTDTLFIDIDGDLVSDAFLLKGKDDISGAEIVGPNAIEAHLIASNQLEKGISFRSTGDVSVELHLNARGVANMFIGASGTHPPSPGGRLPIKFTMSASDPAVQGMKPHNSNPTKSSIYTGYNSATQTWELWNVPADYNYVYAYINSTQPVSNLQVFGLITALDTPRSPVFLGSATGSYVDRTSAVGMNPPLLCNSVVAADFDNDMDVDLYVGCRNAVSNRANELFENQNGIFVPVSNAGGAAGPTGPGTGLTESVSIGDFDVDGRVDLLVLNGLLLYPERPFSNGGPTKLFRNVSNNGNHWVEIDLVGTTSNRDAVGTRVVATSGGVSQLREQGGNYRRWTQNHKRLHFGLGTNTAVDLQVTWPTGVFQTFTNVAADKLYRITEGGAIQQEVLGPVGPSPCGDAGGLPVFDSSIDRGIFMGKNCIEGGWSLRATAGGGFDNYRGSIVSSQPFTSVTGIGLAGNDSIDNSDPKVLAFVLGVGGSGEDGIDFSFPAGADVCFNLTQPTDAAVKVGHNNVQVAVPFDLGTLGPCQTNVPPECDLPNYDPATERAVFLGKNCSTGVWQFRATAGGSSVTYQGGVTSSQPFTSKTDFSLESNDVVSWSPGSSQIDYLLNMGGSGQDGFNFAYPAGSAVCVGVNAPAGVPVYRGAGRQLMTVPFNLDTGASCGSVTPVVSANSVAVSEGAGTLDFQVTLSQASSNTVSVNYATVDGTATAPGDYTAVSNTLTFTPGQTSKTVNVTIIDDALSESTESFTLALSNPVNATLGSNGTGTINDNDGAPVLPTVSANSVAVSEGAGTLDFQVTLSQASSNTVSVNYATVDGTATAPGDYTAVSNTLTFTPGQTSKTVNVTIIDDALSESTESFTLALSNAVNATLGSNGTGTINDNDAASCGVATYDPATEQAVFLGKNCSTGAWQFRATAGGSSVTYQGRVTSNQPFSSKTDFSLEPSDVVSWTAGSSQIDYSLNMGGSGQDGFNFTYPAGSAVCVNVNTPPGVAVYLGAGRQLVTAPFDLESGGPCSNVLPVVSANSVAVSEGAGTLDFQVTLSQASSDTVSVNYATVDGTATAPGDYTAVSNTLTFTSGQTTKTVNVAIIDDAESESTESFTLALSNPVNATLGSNGTGTITDNEVVSCGLATYNPATEQAVFLGKNCSTGAWQFRATAGGSSVTYQGRVTSSQPFTSKTDFNLEPSDVVSWTSGSSQIDYSLMMGGSGQDGFNFTYPAGSAVCVNVDVPQGVAVYLGAGRQSVSAHFDPETGGPCM